MEQNAQNTTPSALSKLDMQSPDHVNQNLEKLAALFPNCVTEGTDGHVVDFDLLKQELNHAVVEGPKERYRLEWPGKKEAIVTANLPTNKTLRPVREESVDFDNTENLYIEGDNLEVLKLLQESYLGKIKMIYIDPPYNTGKDFVYKDNFSKDAQQELIESGQKDEYNQRLVVNPETSGRYHSDWLSMMYPRLKLARNLLNDEGIIAVSIADHEFSNTIALMNEIYGEKNRICIFTWKSRAKPTNAGNAKFRPQKVSEYVIVYGRKTSDEQIFNVVSSKQRTYPHKDENGRSYRTTTILTSNRGTFRRDTMRFESGGYQPDEDFRWKAGKEIIDDHFEKGKIILNEDGNPMLKQYEDEESDPLYPIYTYIDPELSGTAETGKSDLNAVVGNKHGMDTVKPVQLIKYLVSTFSSSNDTILDFFSGSATTAQAVLELNQENIEESRYFILVQIPELIDEDSEAFSFGFKTILDIGKKRIKNLNGSFRYFKLDSSNMQDVYYKPLEYQQSALELFADNIKPDRTPDDLLAQVMLDWGLPLSLKIERLTIAGKQVLRVAENSLYACFDKGIDEAFAKAIAKDKPLRVVFRDSGFANDTAKINVQQLLKQLSPDTEMKVI
jgi:adenine-specific DNA-methyltransferase